MRHDAPFLVKHYAPMIGRPNSPKRIRVAHQAYRLADAMDWAIWASTRESLSRVWIERRGQKATRR